MPRAVEICVTDIAGARAAAEGGAHRVELCADIASGGITPSIGLIAAVARAVPIPVHVLIRPRPGDFVYDGDDIGIMLTDIDAARAAGASGVVIGALTCEMQIDLATVARLAGRARPLSVTFHRGFDLVRDPMDALESLVALNIERVLTSGGPGPARENMAILRPLSTQAAGRIVVMAGGSIAESDLPGLLDLTGVDEAHLHSGVAGVSFDAHPFGARPARIEAERVRRVVRAVRS